MLRLLSRLEVHYERLVHSSYIDGRDTPLFENEVDLKNRVKVKPCAFPDLKP